VQRKTVQLLSTGSYLPGEPISNAVLEQIVGPLPEDVLEGIQVKQRHWIVDPVTGEHRESNSDMAVKAACAALERAQRTPEDVDLLITCSASPDYLLPPLATFVQARLGLRNCATLDIRSGCAGWVEGLDIARLYLEQGIHRTAVVIGSETISPLLVPVFLGKEPERIRMRNRMNPYNFGDAAGAAVVAVAEGPEGMTGGVFACLGGLKEPGMQIVGAGTHAPIHEQLRAPLLVDLKVDVVEAGRFTPYVLTEALDSVLAATGLRAEDIDVCIIPEGNAGYVTDELTAAGLDTQTWKTIVPRVFENLALVGATGSAAVPVALDHVWRTGQLNAGDRVMLLAIETSRWKYAGEVLTWTAAKEPAQPVAAAETK
jgi:3-oxoacyl-[acyl-carrier-protein] synthase III